MRGVFEDLSRFVVTLGVIVLIMWAFIHYGPCGIERPVKIEWIIKYFPVVCKCSIVSLPLVFLAFVCSSFFVGMIVFIRVSRMSSFIKIFLILISCFPVFVTGIFLLRIIPVLHPVISFIIAGLVLSFCDAFFIELYRHAEIEITAVKNEPYFLMAKANGLKGRKLFWYIKNDIIIHFLKILTSKLILLISSAVVIEWIFNLKGIGNLVITAVEQKDIELLICIEIFIVGFVILCSIVNRRMDRSLDPRLRVR